MNKKLFIVLFLLFASNAWAIDWTNDPDANDTTADMITALKDRDERAIKMDFTSDTNLPVGTISFDNSTDRIKRWNGSSWDNKLADYTSHLTNTSNPHTVTAAQVGNSTAQWNANKLQGVDVTISSVGDNECLAYDNSSGDWINQTAAEAGLATASDLTSHTGNTSNPHSVTATQAGALAASNNLSDLGSASTARTNLGLGSIATQAASSVSITGGSITNIADLHIVDGGTGASDATTARNNFGAAASGTNADITALTDIGDIENDGAITIEPGGALNLNWNSTARIICTGNDCYPATASGVNLGSNSKPFNAMSINTVNFTGTYGSSTKAVGTDAPLGWIQMLVNGSTPIYIPYYSG